MICESQVKMFVSVCLMARMRGFRALIMGPPGSGKGYVSDMIVKTFGAVHIAAGDILRKHIHQGTALGKHAFHMISQGKLVPDHLLHGVIATAVYKAEDRNFILDGYPRNLAQAKHLQGLVKLDMVINLNIPDEAIVNMLKNRLVHMPSGRVYNEGSAAPRVPGHDDVTGDPLTRRVDDHPKVVQARLAAFDKQMQPVIRFYMKQNILYTITGRQHRNLWPLVHKFLKKRWIKRSVRPFRPPRNLDLVKLC